MMSQESMHTREKQKQVIDTNDSVCSLGSQHCSVLALAHLNAFPITSHATQWMLGNVFRNSLTQTSAFEIWANDQLVSDPRL